MSGSTPSPCRSPPARCAPPARRWARCSSAARTRPTSRSAATARPRCSTPAARWSCRPSTSRSTSARCRRRSPRCSARTTRPASSWVLNDPYAGGTHLPDITVVTPVFDDGRASCSASPPSAPTTPTSAAASRARCPPTRRTLDEEGVVIAPRVLDDAAIEELVGADAPARRAPRRPARAARRPTASARARVRELAERLGADGLRDAIAAVLDYAERRTRACLAALPDGTRARARRARGRRRRPRAARRARPSTATADRSTSPAAPRRTRGNLNCPLAVTRSACLFAVRVLTDPDIPPSAGALPAGRGASPTRGTLLNARAPAAVAAGNVETSSRVADLVLARVRPRAAARAR